MSAPVPSTRRLAIAIGAAAASATVALGVTAASLLGWFRPTAEPSVSEPVPEMSAPASASPVILVPVTPAASPQPAPDLGGEVQLAMDERRDRDDHDDHDDHDDDDDDGERGDDDDD